MTTEAPARPTKSGMSVEELLALPLSVNIPTAGRAWGIGRTKAHELARSGDFPCKVVRVGKGYRVTRTALLTSLGVDPDLKPTEN